MMLSFYSYMYYILFSKAFTFFKSFYNLIMDSANRGQEAVQTGRNDSEINHW